MLTIPPLDKSIDLQRITDYYADPRLSQSELKNIIKKYQKKDDSPFMQKGSLLDVLIFTPWIFDDLYYVCDLTFDGYIIRLAHYIIDACANDPEYAHIWLNDQDQAIVHAFAAIQYKVIKKAETMISKKELILQAIDMLTLSKDKTIITTEEKEQTESLAQRAVSFIHETYYSYIRDGWTLNVQQVYHFNTEGEDCKCMLDLVLMSPDRQNMEIIPVDFKWTSSPLQFFHEQMRSFRYDFQGAFYSEGVQLNHPTAFVHNFEIIVYSATDDAFERITLSDTDLNVGKHGMSVTHTYKTGSQKLSCTYSTYGFIDTIRMLKMGSTDRRNYSNSTNNSIWF